MSFPANIRQLGVPVACTFAGTVCHYALGEGCCAHAHNVLNTLSTRSMHVVCCMRDTVYYVQIHDTDVRVIDFNQRKDIIYNILYE
jgi:hypothetical protein